jgi:DhnA family fructose-bisphosphate aldolase class Ia
MLENAYRIAFEIGADILKVPYLEDRPAFARMMRNLPIPALILGGGKMETEMDIFKVAKEACEDGARGILFGRNIWQHENPSGMITALHGIVHGKSSIAQALACISGKGA